MWGLTVPHRRLMRANYRCEVIIRQVRGACSRAAQSPRLCGRRAVVRSAFSETKPNAFEQQNVMYINENFFISETTFVL